MILSRLLNGTTDYWQGSPPVTGAPFVISGWFYTSDISTASTLVSIHSSGGSGGTHRFSVVAAGSVAGDPIQFVANNNATQATAATSTGYQANTWHHFLAIARTANDREIRLDNAGAGTNTTSKTASSVNRMNFGARIQTSSTQFFSGLIAAVGVWGAADHTEDEYAALAGGVHPFRIRPQSLASFVDLASGYDEVLGSSGTFSGSTMAEGPPLLRYPEDSTDWLYIPPAGVTTLFRRPRSRRAGSRGAA